MPKYVAVSFQLIALYYINFVVIFVACLAVAKMQPYIKLRGFVQRFLLTASSIEENINKTRAHRAFCCRVILHAVESRAFAIRIRTYIFFATQFGNKYLIV